MIIEAGQEYVPDVAEIKALAFVRGGSDGASLRMWNDPDLVGRILSKDLPFYTAVGHSDSILLADKYSDESFATPTAFGDSFANALADLADEQEKDARLSALYQEKRTLEAPTLRLIQKNQRYSRVLSGIVAALIVAGLIVLRLATK